MISILNNKDANYIRQREKLIPIAEKFANDTCGKKYDKEKYRDTIEYGTEWNKAFHGKMDVLLKENGIKIRKFS